LSLLWQAFGNLNNAGNSGLACANLNNGLGNGNWNIGARASGKILIFHYAVHSLG
jgi:hypothetical protein